MRGARCEATKTAQDFIERSIGAGRERVYVLHGHGTGALKTGLRRFLKADARVKSASPAAHDDGGDAFTRVELRRS